MNQAVFKSGTRAMFDGQLVTITVLPEQRIALTFELLDCDPAILTFDDVLEMVGGRLNLVKGHRPATKVQVNLTYEQDLERGRRQAYVDELKRVSPRGGPGGPELREKVIARVQRRLQDPVGVSPAQLARWLDREKTHSHGLASYVIDLPNDRRKRLSQEARDRALEAMVNYLLPTQFPNVQLAYDSYQEDLLEDGWDLKDIPCCQTFRDWTKEMLSPLQVTEATKGKRAQRAWLRNAIKKLHVERILERVEVDAVSLAIGLVDDNGKYLGTVTLFVVLDCYSRSVMGFQIQIGRGESAASVIDSYKHAFLPKTRDSYSLNVTCLWPMFGLPELIVSDGGPGYKALETGAFLLAAGCDAEIVDTASGWKKPYIEVFFKTLRTTLLSQLPGYCGKIQDQQEQDVKARERACLTPRQFQDLLTKWIVDEYHQAYHRGLCDTPHNTWLNSAKYHPPCEPVNRDLVQWAKGVQEMRTISGESGHLGVVIQNVSYNDGDGRLKNIALRMRHLGDKPEVLCRYSPNDMSYITVVDPFTNEIFPVYAVDDRVEPNMSLSECKAVNPSHYRDKGFGRKRVLKGDETVNGARQQHQRQVRNAEQRQAQYVSEEDIAKEIQRQQSQSDTSDAGHGLTTSSEEIKLKKSRRKSTSRNTAGSKRKDKGYDYE